MIHVALMRKSWGLTQKILNGEKTIESRWYLNRSRPWNQINAGDTIYFKDSGEPVRLKAIVDKVLQFDQLNPEKVRQVLKKYGRADGIREGDFDKYFTLFKNKRYCILIFLKDVRPVRLFNIDKTGFGAMSAWLIVDDLNKIRHPIQDRVKE